MADHQWQTISSRVAYQNPWLTVREDQVIRPDGTPGVYGVLDMPASVYILALSERQEVYLIKQYRYPTKKWGWEVPGGSSDGQDLLGAAKRELQEETGLTSQKWQELGSFQVYIGISNEIVHIFLAEELVVGKVVNEGNEQIKSVVPVPFGEVLEMVQRGEVADVQSASAIFLLQLYLQRQS